MPDGDDDHGPPSTQPHLHSPPWHEPFPSHQSHRPSHAADYLPLDRLSTLTISSGDGPLLPTDSYHPESSSFSKSQPTYIPEHTSRADESPSPDPSEFYRPYAFNDAQKSPGLGSLLPSADIDPGMTTVISTPHSPEISKQLDTSSYIYNRPAARPSQLRSTSRDSSIPPGDAALRPQPLSFAGPRNRQASFKDLVERFNKNVDQVPPIPSALSSRAASPSPALGSRSPSRTDTSEAHRRPAGLSPPTSFPPAPTALDKQDKFQQSVYQSPPLSSSQNFGGQGIAQRPLFGDILTLDTAVNNHLGQGAFPSHSRRRGSESSIPSPHPFFIDNPQPGGLGQAVSPSSPTAWYLGYTQSLESVNSGVRSRSHHRSRSDASWTTMKPIVASPLGVQMASTSLHGPLSPTTHDSSPFSKSRIPVASRRTSHASDCSSPSSPSTRTSSALGFHHNNGNGNNSSSSQIPLAPKGSSRLPKPLTLPTSSVVTSPERNTPIPTTIKSPTRRNVTHNHGSPRQVQDKGSLKVYVSAPPPKMSPPLRSSRPRQPVSAASTAASRAKVVDRVSRFQASQDSNDHARNSRTKTRKPPELGNVDFAARRQRIQQAFNKSVQETAKKEEEAAERRRQARYRRDEQVRSMLIREGELRKIASMESTSTPVETHGNNTPQPNTSEESTLASSSSPLVSPEDQLPTPTLSINTSNLHNAHQPQALSSEVQNSVVADSPTLGVSTALNIRVTSTPVDTPRDDIPPLSAITVATNGTDSSNSTNFDPEPQAGLDNQESHRDLLNRIMQLRESSSSDECDEDEDEDEDDEDDDDDDNELCDAETDERESIRIMLDPARSTFFLDEIDPNENGHPEVGKTSSETMSHGDPNRWSVASWASSSAREQQSSSDSHCDAEDGPQPTVEQGEKPLTHLNAIPDSPRRQSAYGYLHDNPIKSSDNHRRQQSHPDNLIRQGGWDSTRVTQLYLQQLARGGFQQSFDPTWEIPQPEERNQNKSKPDDPKDVPIMAPRTRDLRSKEGFLPQASLNFRDDWENASPSIADWMQVAADDESALSPRNDAGVFTSSNGAKPEVSEVEANPIPQDTGSSWNGLGLAINVQSPVDDARITAVPPMPPYGPPPAPKETTAETLEPSSQTPAPQSVSPSVYTSQPPSSNLSSSPFPTVEDHQPVRHSEDSYLTQTGYTQSPGTVASSATSQNHVSASDPIGEAPAGSPTPEQKQLKQRRNVIKELVDTEYTYGRDMKVVDDIYKGTSSSCLDLSVDDARILFGNSDQIVQFSMIFQDALKQAAKSVYVMPKSQRWGSKKGNRSTRNSSPAETYSSTSDLSSFEQDQSTFVGHVFIENMSQMEKVYTEYLKNHDAANKKLQILQRNPKVEIWLKECRDWAADLTDAWNLDALLVKPVQRLVKYPLLLTQLINATPQSHPDRTALVQALEGVTKISVRINDLKKRADVVGQVVSSRKRKDSDVRLGLSKAFGRRTEKLRQQVGLSEMYEDTAYNTLANRFNEHFFQLQVVMRDVEMYTREIKSGMDKFGEFIATVQGCADPAHSSHPDIESKWHRLRVYTREIINVALPGHLTAVRKGVIDPMLTVLKLYEGPQKVMTKRDKRLLDYARYKSVKDRGDKPDKRTTEQGEQFSVINEALKDELPRLFNLTAKLMEACLRKFVSTQQEWYQTLQQKLGPALDRYPGDVTSIVNDWSANFALADTQIMSLALCNGALLSEAGNLVNFNAPATDGPTSPRRPSTMTNSSTRTASGTFESSPKVSHDLGTNGTSIHSYGMDGQSDYTSNASQSHVAAATRDRANSSVSGIARTESVSGHSGNGVVANALSPARSSTGSTGRQTESAHTAPQLSLDMPFMRDPLIQDTNGLTSRAIDSTASPARFSGFFSSAMPMPDSPMQETTTTSTLAAPSNLNPNPNPNPKVLFLAASLYEFHIDRSRREAGYPYLTYTEGEVFDVIAEKGELWLAKNQDDPTGQVGWIWTQHFAKLPG